MGLRQNQQQIENKSINDIINMVQRSQSAQSISRRQEKTMDLNERKFLHKQKLDNFKNIFELKKAMIADSNLTVSQKNARTRELSQRSLENWQDAQIEYNEDVRGIKTEVFEDPDGVNRVYFVKGSEKVGDAIRTANIKDLGKSKTENAKKIFGIQTKIDNITLDKNGKSVIPPIENLKKLRTYTRTLGKELKVIDIPRVETGFDTNPIRIPFIVDGMDSEITENQIRDTLANKYGWSSKNIEQAIAHLKTLTPEEYEMDFGE